MNSHAAAPAAPTLGFHDPPARRPPRVLVLFEPTPSGAAALRAAAQSSDEGGQLTVVTLAPQSVQPRCCARGPSVEVVNCVVREEAESELLQAREILGDAAGRATFKSLVGTQDPPLGVWAAGQGFELIILPSRRRAFGGHPLARRLRRATSAELRLIG
jgi:hypothetical protein